MPKQIREKTRYQGVTISELENGDQSLYIRYRLDGKMIEETVGRKSRGMTAAKAKNLRESRISGNSKRNSQVREEKRAKTEADANRWTLKRLFDEYLASRPDLKGVAFDRYRFANHLSELAQKTPEELTHFDLKKLRHRLEKQGNRPATVRHALELVRRIANFGAKKGFTMRLAFTIDMPRVDNQVTEDLTPAQLKRLLQVLDEHEAIGGEEATVARMMKLAFFTGMRRGEIFGLEWKDLDFGRGFIHLRDPKGGRDSSIPMNDEAQGILQAQMDEKKDNLLVFPGRGGKKRVDARKRAEAIMIAAGLPKKFRPFHGLRHVYASMLASSGQVDLYTLQTLLTHKSPIMTARYAHLRDDALRRASNLAAKLARSEEPEKIMGLVN